MKPISPQIYRGIEFVQLDKLPEDQKLQLAQWLPGLNKIKIQAENELMDRCITYSDYTFWFENFYRVPMVG